MGVLSNLPGTIGDKEFELIHAPSEAIDAIQAGKAAMAAADNGCINVWIDDLGKYRCDAQRHRVSVDSRTFTRLMDVGSWCKLWLEKIQ